MSQTYYDYGALEQLLEERERDLELAARIGQTLLEKNRQLADQVSQLECSVSSFNDENAQLKHSLQLKDDLIKGCNDDKYDDGTSAASTPSVSGRLFRGGYTVQEHVQQLEERINRLQVENCELRQDIEVTVNKLTDRDSEYHKIVDSTVSDYNSVNRKLQLFRQELACKTQECFEQQEQITRLLAQLVDAQREKKELQVEAEENLNAFEESQQTQMMIMAEFSELEKRYLETVRMLEENQSHSPKIINENDGLEKTFAHELQSLDCQTRDNSVMDLSAVLKDEDQTYGPDSIDAQMESKHGPMESGIFEDASRDMLTSTLEHISQSAIKNSQQNLNNSLSEVHCGIPLHDKAIQIFPEPNRTPPHPPIASGAVTPIYSPSTRCSSIMSSGKSTPLIGKAGVPGSRDLEKALKRLAQRRSVENKIIEERRRRTSLYRNKLYSETNSSLESAAGSKNNEKLRIIKTMEGSPLMQQWRYMAQVDLDTAVSQIASAHPTTPEGQIYSAERPRLRPRPVGSSAKVSLNNSFELQSNRQLLTSSPDLQRKKGIPERHLESPVSVSSEVSTVETCESGSSRRCLLTELDQLTTEPDRTMDGQTEPVQDDHAKLDQHSPTTTPPPSPNFDLGLMTSRKATSWPSQFNFFNSALQKIGLISSANESDDDKSSPV